MVRFIYLLLLFAPLVSHAQFTYFLDQDIPVEQLTGEALTLPWAGGLNAAQINTMDLDGDGADDLVIFDRTANKVITFLSRDNQYVPAHGYEDLFPEGVSNWLLLRDYNCDGKKDIFTGDILGIKVFRNVTTDAGNLQWEQHLFYRGADVPKSDVVLTQGFSTKVNLQLQIDDLPSISDVDGDGDLDILNVQYAGYSVEFHKNLSVENNWSCDSLEFERITRTWGEFRDCECGVFAYDGTACPPDAGGRTKHAGGKSLLALDFNGDQQQDLLFSDADCTLLYALPNEGTTLNPVINTANSFPQTNPVNFVVFPAAFYEDVDFDGKKDLIATPNLFAREYLNTNFQHSVWFYKNTGTASHPAFSLVERNFLQNQMIDVGDNAVPAFADLDGDGDFDMFISNHSSVAFTSAVYLYENTGWPAAPSFRLVNDDYLGFSTSRFYNLRIQFADMDSDQTPDLVFTATSFDDYSTQLYYFPNKSKSHLDYDGVSLRAVPFSLTSTENVSITDVNEDGLPDILAGRSEGNLEYWKNSGIEGDPLFVLEEERFLGFDISTIRQNLASAAADLDADGKADLIIGDQSGNLSLISDFRGAGATVPLAEKNILFNPLAGVYGDKNLGGRVWPAVVNLFNSDKPVIAAGNALGGVHLLRHDEGRSLPEEPVLNIYPNPIARSEVLNIQVDRQGTLQVYSLLGQAISTPVFVKANQVQHYTLPSLASGLYLLKFTAGKKSRTSRLVVR